MMVGWVREMNPQAFIRDAEEGTVVIDADQFMRLDAYETSTPTAPSAGRVYRRTYQQRDANGEVVERPYVFFVENTPADDPRGGQLHHPHEALIVEGYPQTSSGDRQVKDGAT